MKPHFPKPNYPLIMGWLFIASVVFIPVSWLFLNNTALLWSILLFASMFVYQFFEVLYDEYKRKRDIEREIRSTRHLDGSNIIDSMGDENCLKP